MGRISPGPTRWPPGAERRLVPAKSNLKPPTITHYLLPCVRCLLSLSLALSSLLHLPYPLCAPHLFPSLAPSALLPFPGAPTVQATCGPLARPAVRRAPLAPCPVLWPHSAPGSLCLYAHGAGQRARQTLSHPSALSLPAPGPWVLPVPLSSLSPRLTYPCPPVFGSPRSTLHDTMQPQVPYIAQRARVSSASRYAAKVVGPAAKPAASQP